MYDGFANNSTESHLHPFMDCAQIAKKNYAYKMHVPFANRSLGSHSNRYDSNRVQSTEACNTCIHIVSAWQQ